MKKDELFQEIDCGRPTPEQAARMIELAMGDTSSFMLDSDVPNVAADAGAGDAGEASADADDQADNTQQNTDAQQGAADDSDAASGDQKGKTPDATELNADNAVILAKDGKHTIGYEKLVEARQGEQHWKAQAQAAQVELQRLRDEAAARATAGEAPTSQDNQLAAVQAAMDQGVDPAIFGDFSEEELAAGIQKLIDAKVGSARERTRGPEAGTDPEEGSRERRERPPECDLRGPPGRRLHCGEQGVRGLGGVPSVI
ncbi:hypothetical protein QT611_13440 [Pseudomonas aeruginosa]|nr:hypothetical protein [Pseudomonas aeruginosa]MDX8041624.1 hypothetical protein [Pseudomonas aeruginosa]